nr:uncharacterized protein CTRU02_00675 [Colletotrichum truncatum]KAF6801926.1 hypothetical protein CTRU02_00675 [Colletotrichum truncatum]
MRSLDSPLPSVDIPSGNSTRESLSSAAIANRPDAVPHKLADKTDRTPAARLLVVVAQLVGTPGLANLEHVRRVE